MTTISRDEVEERLRHEAVIRLMKKHFKAKKFLILAETSDKKPVISHHGYSPAEIAGMCEYGRVYSVEYMRGALNKLLEDAFKLQNTMEFKESP